MGVGMEKRNVRTSPVIGNPYQGNQSFVIRDSTGDCIELFWTHNQAAMVKLLIFLLSSPLK